MSVVKLVFIEALLFDLSENPITVGNGKFWLIMPYDGQIIGSRNGPKVYGCIQTVGSGGGATQMQLTNQTTGKTYFVSGQQPQFRVVDDEGNGRAPLVPGTLKSDPTFRQGDMLTIDVDGLPGGSDSALGQVYVLCEMLRDG